MTVAAVLFLVAGILFVIAAVRSHGDLSAIGLALVAFGLALGAGLALR